MSALAFVRPDSWDFPLFLHVLGAMVLVGALVLALGYLASAWRGQSADSLRVGFRVLLYGAFPGYIVMRVGRAVDLLEGGPRRPPHRPVLGRDRLRRRRLRPALPADRDDRRRRRRPARAHATAGEGGTTTGTTSVRVAAVCTGLLLVAYLVALWAMTTKPM